MLTFKFMTVRNTKSNQDTNIEELNKLINGAYQVFTTEDAINYCRTQSHEIFLGHSQ